ncbi:LysR family transcriptional regulator [Caldimonas tepidiphila]|uniref:LysR family transcriptional regulator n=1 Tax=Caldimonas tepidiphila TaxID=2315841 RepID=UPI001F0CD7DF|nr:LysR family transcriptional regulator [Caldimonas tepidiphila]
MHIKDFDLNLLHVFQAVYAARNVSRAAENLGLSQPAVSHALTRLRLSLHDPLFVRASGGVAPTPKADHFARQVEAAMKVLDVALHESDVFEPARSQRRFAVYMSDIGADEFLPQLMREVSREAPGVRVEVVPLDPAAIVPALEDGRIDLAFGYLPEVTGTERARLLDERYVVLLRRGHPLAGRLQGREALQQLDFILVSSHVEPARALHLLGLESRIRLTLPHFAVVPSILAATDLAVVMPLRPARTFARRHALQVVEPDLGLPPFTVWLHWYWRFHNDPGQRWLREIALRMRFDERPHDEPDGSERTA